MKLLLSPELYQTYQKNERRRYVVDTLEHRSLGLSLRRDFLQTLNGLLNLHVSIGHDETCERLKEWS